ncbi:MAG: hypothetical protein AB7V58_17310 [Solirubrobacterales bacterium]
MRGIEESGGAAALAALPHVDEHAYEVAAGAGEAWAALQVAVERSFGGGRAERVARVLGCEDTKSHRFSHYAPIFRVDSLAPDRSRVRAETRAEFPGVKGSVYRALVIGSRGPVVLTRRVLAAVKRGAERSAAAPSPVGGS